MISDKAEHCPNCGTPANGGGSAQTAYSNVGQSNADYSNAGYVTTSDTGYKSETTLKRIGDIAFIVFWIIGAYLALMVIIAGIGMLSLLSSPSPYGFYRSGPSVGSVILVILFGLVMAVWPILCAYAARSMAYTISNMSINLHEINMKTK